MRRILLWLALSVGACGAEAAEEAESDVQAACGCSADRQEIRCGRRSSRCDASEVCSRGACTKAERPYGTLAFVRSGEAATLDPGDYALAIVQTEPADGDIPFPVTIDGATNTRGDGIQARSAPMPLTSVRLEAAAYAKPPRLLGPTLAPAPGETRTFHVGASSNPNPRPGVLRRSGRHANIWVDTTNPSHAPTEAILDELLARYDEGVMPRFLALFGPPTDVDENGKIDIFLTDALGPLEGGYVWPAITLRPPGYYRETFDHGEIVYAQIPSNPRDVARVAGTLAHETHHLFFLGARFLPFITSGQEIPAVEHAGRYLREGLAELSLALSGQRPLSRGRDTFREVATISLSGLFVRDYADDPASSQANYGFATYVAGYLFSRAGGVRIEGKANVKNGGGADWHAKLVRTPPLPEHLTTLQGEPIATWYPDFAAALLLSSVPSSGADPAKKDTRFQFMSGKPDPVYGGFLGFPLNTKESGESYSAPFVVRTRWSDRPRTMRRGGLRFFEFSMGEATGKLKVSGNAAVAAFLRL